MKKILAILVLSASLFSNDIIVKQSDYSVDETIENIKKIVKAKGFGVFAVINHQGNAKMVDLKLNESKVIIFGNPKIGTLLMQEDMRVALDLPLRVLVYKDEAGQVKLAYRDGSWLKDHHVLGSDKLTDKVNKGMDKITDKARLKVQK
ncbi:DUF302 domain-containing protein [Campylobacterota bacterium]